MKSALTAQLEAASVQEETASKPQATSAPLKLLHNAAFPCLRHAKGEVVEAITVTGFEDEPLTGISLSGTAPSRTVTADMADYELNPFKRRGGEEIVSSSFAGLSLGRQESLTAKGSLIGGEVMGSLPAALTMEEKKEVMQSVQQSPALSLVSQLGVDKVDAPTTDGTMLRRSVLKGCVIVFITAGYSGKRFIFERCKQLGLRCVIIDGPESWSKQLVSEGLAERFIGLDFTDADTTFDRMFDACKKVRAELGSLEAVTTFCELAVPLAARLAERLGVPTNSPLSVDTARNKHAARACMADAGLPTPLNYLIESDAQLDAAAAHVGFPAVIKPISGAASIGVIRVNDIDELKKSYTRVMRDLSGANVVAGALVEGDGTEAGDGNAAAWMDLSIMMEEYLDGPEVDVDLVLSGGEAVYGAITDNWPTVEPYFNETGSNCPSMLPRAQQMELMDLGIKSLLCMGFEMGVFHVELKYTSRGPRLIEVNARMGGGPVRDTNLLVWGVDLVEQHVTSACGIPCRPPVAQTPIRELAELTINAAVTGILEQDDFMEACASKENVLYARPLLKPGSKCVSVADGLPTWLGEMMVTLSPVDKAVEWIKEMEAELVPTIAITPKPLAAL